MRHVMGTLWTDRTQKNSIRSHDTLDFSGFDRTISNTFPKFIVSRYDGYDSDNRDMFFCCAAAWYECKLFIDLEVIWPRY